MNALRRLRARAIELAHDAQIGCVLIDPQQDPLVRLLGLRIGRRCVEVIAMSVGFHFGEGVGFSIHKLKLPPVAALANTHAILGR